MELAELKRQLRSHPDLNVAIVLPDGTTVPNHYHVTEVGHVSKKFVDCGGTFRASETCVLQTWIGKLVDDGHRLTAGKLGFILDLARPIIPSDEVLVEVEYEAEVVSQFPLTDITTDEGALTLILGLKHTDCLAREKCGAEASCSGESEDEEAGCCSSPGLASGQSCC